MTRGRAPMALRDRTALITGAAGGIGRALALALAQRGMHLALLDNDEGKLAQTAALAAEAQERTRISAHLVDLTDQETVRDLPRHVLAAHPGLDLLVNNAGVATGGRFEQVDEADFDWLLAVNLGGVVRMTRTFLPLLRAGDDARIVNMSSLYGLVAPAGQTAYAASKFAVRGFTLALAAELAGTVVGVTLVMPGGVATGIAANARFGPSIGADEAERLRARAARHLTLPPPQAAEAIVRAVERRRRSIVIGRDARILAMLERLLPGSAGRVLARFGAEQ